jgi:hypothetical protein
MVEKNLLKAQQLQNIDLYETCQLFLKHKDMSVRIFVLMKLNKPVANSLITYKRPNLVLWNPWILFEQNSRCLIYATNFYKFMFQKRSFCLTGIGSWQ